MSHEVFLVMFSGEANRVIEEVYFGKAKDIVGDLRSTYFQNDAAVR